jgi:hypothetical protein
MIYPPAFFSYQVTPTAVPYSRGAAPGAVTLMFTVSNRLPSPVHVDVIAFTLPIGTAGSELTADPARIVASPATDVNWTIGSDGTGTLIAQPGFGNSGLRAGESIAFFVSGIIINESPGTASVTIWEQTDRIRQSDVAITKAPPGLAITEFRASPVQIGVGQPCYLSWTTTGAGLVTLSWGGNVREVDLSRSEWQVSPSLTTVYTLTASGDDKVIHQQLTVYVPKVEILSFAAAPAVIRLGGRSILRWMVVNAARITITASGRSPDPGEVDPQVSHLEVTPAQPSTTYTLRAEGYGRSVSMTAEVDYEPTIESFTVQPDALPKNSRLPVTVAWRTRNTHGVVITPGIGDEQSEGSKEVIVTGVPVQYELRAKHLPTPAVASLAITPAIVRTTITFIAKGITGTVDLGWTIDGEKATWQNGNSVAVDRGIAVREALGPNPGVQTLRAVTSPVNVYAIYEISTASGSTEFLQFESFYGINTVGGKVIIRWRAGPNIDMTLRNGGKDEKIKSDGTTSSHEFTVKPDPSGWSLTSTFGTNPSRGRVKVTFGPPVAPPALPATE